MNNYVVVLGSNLSSEFGNSAETLKKCVDEIRSNPSIECLLESNWYISSSFLSKRDPRYVNVGISFDTKLKPIELLNFTSGLENKYGRKRRERWGPRTCDIDILLCDQQILPSKLYFSKWLNLNFSDQISLVPNKLILPHPKCHLRNFVLYPILQIDPNWSHPILKKNVQILINKLSLKSRIQITRLRKNVNIQA